MGPSIDVGPALTAKILKANGEVVHRSTYRSLQPHEWTSEEEKKSRDDFDSRVNARYGGPMKPADLADPNNYDLNDHTRVETISDPYELYEDDEEKNEPAPDIDDFTPEEGDEYLNAQVLLPHGGTNILPMLLLRTCGLSGPRWQQQVLQEAIVDYIKRDQPYPRTPAGRTFYLLSGSHFLPMQG